MNIEEFKLKMHDIMLTNINWMISCNLEKNNAQARRKLFAEWGGDYSDEKLSEYANDCINVLIENRIFEKLIPSDNIDYEDVEVQWRMSGEFIFNYKGDYCFTVDHKSFASSYGEPIFADDFYIGLGNTNRVIRIKGNGQREKEHYCLYNNKITKDIDREKVQKSFAIIRSFLIFFGFNDFLVNFERISDITSDDFNLKITISNTGKEIFLIKDNQSSFDYMYEVFSPYLNDIGIKDGEGLKKYITSCKQINKFLKNNKLPFSGIAIDYYFSHSDYREPPYIFFRNLDYPNFAFVINIDAGLSVKSFLDQPIYFFNYAIEWEGEYYKDSGFTTKDYIKDKKHVLDYLSLIDY